MDCIYIIGTSVVKELNAPAHHYYINNILEKQCIKRKRTSHQGNTSACILRKCHYLQKKSFETTLEIFQLMKDCTNTNSRTHIRSTLFSDDNVLS